MVVETREPRTRISGSLRPATRLANHPEAAHRIRIFDHATWDRRTRLESRIDPQAPKATRWLCPDNLDPRPAGSALARGGPFDDCPGRPAGGLDGGLCKRRALRAAGPRSERWAFHRHANDCISGPTAS